MPKKENKSQNIKKDRPDLLPMETEYRSCLKTMTPRLSNEYTKLKLLLSIELPTPGYSISKEKFNHFFDEFLSVLKKFKNLYKNNLEAINSFELTDYDKKRAHENLNDLTWKVLSDSQITEFAGLVISIHIENPKSILNSESECFFEERNTYIGEIRTLIGTKLSAILKIFMEQIKDNKEYVRRKVYHEVSHKYVSSSFVSLFSSNGMVLENGIIEYLPPKEDTIIHRDLLLNELLHLLCFDNYVIAKFQPIFIDLLVNAVSELMLLRISQGKSEEAISLYQKHIKKGVLPKLFEDAAYLNAYRMKNDPLPNHIAKDINKMEQRVMLICLSLQELAAFFEKKNNDKSAIDYYKEERRVFKLILPNPAARDAVELISLKIDNIEKKLQKDREEFQEKREERLKKQKLLPASEPKVAITAPSVITDNLISFVVPTRSSDTIDIETSKIKETESSAVDEVKLPKKKTRKAPIANVQPAVISSPPKITNMGFFSEKYHNKNITTFSNSYIPSNIYFGFFEPANVPDAITPKMQEHFKTILENGYLISGDGKNQNGIKSYDTRKKDSEGNPIRGLKVKDCSKDIRLFGHLVQKVTDPDGRAHFLYQFDDFKNHKEQKREMKL